VEAVAVMWQLVLSALWKPVLAVLAVLGLFFGGRRSAQKDTRIKTLANEVDAHEIRNEVENRVARDRDARERLRDEWSR
jgi:sulfite reductase beta subunit-like hemoprotein